jgi:sporulation protein YlmC with PRC-barrel domain
MRPDGSLKLLAEVRDLQIVDSDGLNCGICDDLELAPEFHIKAMMVGPGAWRGRLPGWLWRFITALSGRGAVHVPWSAVDHVTSRIVLSCPAADVGLRRAEERWKRFLPATPRK